jgi:hypothetical protein
MNSQKAYINRDLFVRWFKESFVPSKAPGTSFLILGGHVLYCSSPELLQYLPKSVALLPDLPNPYS